MTKVNCILIEDNVIEFLKEAHEQIMKGIVCAKCPNPCDKTNRCALAMKNLSIDINMFLEAYKKHNESEQEIEKISETLTNIPNAIIKKLEEQVENSPVQ